MGNSTGKRVNDVEEEYQYRPSVFQRSRMSNTSNSIGRLSVSSAGIFSNNPTEARHLIGPNLSHATHASMVILCDQGVQTKQSILKTPISISPNRKSFIKSLASWSGAIIIT